MRISVAPELAGRLELRSAVEQEIAAPRTLLPSRVVEAALGDHIADYASAVLAQVRSGTEVEAQETVWVPKPGRVGRYRSFDLASDPRADSVSSACE